MVHRNSLLSKVGMASLLLLAATCHAQFKNGSQTTSLNLPLLSQGAAVTQRIGLTDITIRYHRPLVGGREVFGKTVPYGQVWRAGANENTTIEFTDPVTIDGKSLAKGVYGLHMIPNQNEWTVIFSKNSTSWGSFSYNQAEDALRVTVKPQPSELHDALSYDFDNLKPESAVVTMRWEKVAIPFNVGVNVNEVVAQNLPIQLRGLQGFTWPAWDDAARYLLENKGSLDEALKYADRSMQNEERFENLLTKSEILTAQGKKDEGAALQARALDKANAIQMHGFARQLQQQGNAAQAFEIFRANAKKHPDSWITHIGLARVYSGQGDFANASKELKVAMTSAPDPQKPQLDGLLKRLDAKQDINK